MTPILRGILVLLVLVPALACSGTAPRPDPAAPEPAPETEPVTEPVVAAPPEERVVEPAPAVAEPAEPALSDEDWPERTLESLTLRQKVAQMVMPFVLGTYAPKGTAGHERIATLIEEEEVGGFVVSVGTPTDVAVKLNDMQSHSRIPLLFAGDFETGAGFRLSGALHSPTNISLGGATNFPTLMALGATGDAGLAYEMGRITAEEARAVGVHVAFAPVLDVNNNPDNPIINVRALGEDPAAVAELGAALVRGMEENGVVATGKHFPGHGDTETDSHLGLPTIQVTRERMDSVELRPFRRAIDVGMTGVMTAHITVPSLNAGTDRPATLSHEVLTGLLRNEMGFEGLLFTDAMDMGAIDREYGRGEASVLAVEAGADVLLMPPDVPGTIEAVLDAVIDGRIAEERIDASVLRILEAKRKAGLHRDRFTELARLPEVVGIPPHREVADEVARKSITVLRNERNLLPLLGTRTADVLSVTYRRTNDLFAGRYFDAELERRYPRLDTETVGRDTDAPVYDGLLEQASRSDLVVVSLYVTAVSYSGTVALPEDAREFLARLSESGTPHIVVSFGNPYLLREFPDIQSYMLAWSGSESSQRAAAGALFGDFEVTGRTPTRVSEQHGIGFGLTIPPKLGRE